jgi:hypothetical protein
MRKACDTRDRRTSDWHISRQICQAVTVPVWLITGHNPTHVANAIRQVRPWLSPQDVKQRPGFLQVRRVKTLAEPVVDRREQLAGGGALALMLPQAAQLSAARSSQDFACWWRATVSAC